MLRGMGTTGVTAWVVALAGALTLTGSCTHHEPAARGGQPVADVASALQSCPAGFVTKSVNEVLAQSFPRGSCFGVRGRLTATYGATPVLHYLGSAGPTAPGRTGGAPAGSDWPVRALQWVLTDLADPFNPRRDDRGLDAQPTITLYTTRYEPWLLPLQRCNKGYDGKPIMPRRRGSSYRATA